MVEDVLTEDVEDWPGQREFTLHVVFLADDRRQARYSAAAYVEGLNDLRPEVDSFRARISAGGDWSGSESVFCLARPGAGGHVRGHRRARG